MQQEQRKCFEALLKAQARYLIALKQCVSQTPDLGMMLFNLKPEEVSLLRAVDEHAWSNYVNRLNFWVLATRKDFANTCLFEYWVNHLDAEENIGQLINNRLTSSNNINCEDVLGNDFLRYQSSIFEVVLRAVFLAPSFSQGLLLLTDSVIEKIKVDYFDFNTSHYYESVPPLFVFNESIPLVSFFDLGAKGIASVEYSLFSLNV